MLRFCCLYPRALGGYPNSNFLSYFYRGHPDPVTGALSFIKILAQEDDLFKKLLNWLETFPNMKKTQDLTMFVQDPPSNNWDNPVLPTNILKNLLSSCVSAMAKNRVVCFLFHLDWEEKDEKLM